MKSLLRFLPLLFFALLVSSCASWRSGDAYRPDEPLALTAKLSATLTSTSGERSFGGTLRMRRDQVIQLSVTKFGIEGARIIFTPDSVLLLDRLNKRYLQSSYAQLHELGVSQPLSFATVQGFLWNDSERDFYELSTTLMGLLAIDMRIERSKYKRIRGHKIPQRNHFHLNLFDKDHNFYLNLSQLKINYGWIATTRVPTGYQPLNASALLKAIR